MIRNIFLTLAATTFAAATATTMMPHSAKADSNSDTITMAVRVVGLQNSAGKTTLTQDSATKLLSDVSQSYAKAGCNIQFKLESFTAVNPKDKGLEYNTSTMAELDKYRAAFDDGKSMLIVDTGAWDSSMHPANAWTAMPGETKMGAVFESSVADFYQIVGHELGHYLGLDHVDDSSNMMNPVIDDYSVKITPDQCNGMRQVAQTALAASRR
ncbi:MAG: matrixin family metalloprotease [Bdellovibrionia bacterium]